MENIPSTLCTECNKKKIYCKGLCSACNSRRYRKTEKGKKTLRNYNESPQGQESRKKHLAKKGLLKPTKLIYNKICGCGKISKIKGLCNNCYHKIYSRIKRGFLGKQYRKDSRIKDIDDRLFELLLKKVEEGITISDACKLLNIHRNYLYATISDDKKLQLKQIKIISNNNNSIFKGFPQINNDDYNDD